MEDLPAPGMPTSTTERAGAGAKGVWGCAAPATGQADRAELRDTVPEGSTGPPAREDPPQTMFRHPLLLLAALVLGVLVLGLLAIGAFPPSVTPQPVERTIPADRFGPRS